MCVKGSSGKKIYNIKKNFNTVVVVYVPSAVVVLSMDVVFVSMSVLR